MTPDRLARALAIRPGEGRLVALLAGLFFAVEAGRGSGEIGADTLLLSAFGAGVLPVLYIALGLLSLAAIVAYGAALGRLRRRPFLVGLLLSFAVLLVAERLVVATGERAALPALWLTISVLGAILSTLVWVTAGSLLDARQAKRLFPVCTSAAILGSFTGTLTAGPLTRVIGTENLIVVDAAFLVVAAGLTSAVGRRFRYGPTGRGEQRSLVAELRVGFDYVRRTPLMRYVAVAYVIFAVLAFSVSYPFLLAMSQAYTSQADLATALGLLSAAVTAASFVISLTLANRVYARFGVATAALVLPLVYLAGFGSWLVSFGLATVIPFRFAQQVTQRGVSNAAWSAFHNLVPAERRAQVLAFNDGVPGQLGTALSGVLLLAVGALTLRDVFWLGVGAAIVCTWVVLQIRRRYARTLVATLRSGLAEQILEGGPGLAAFARDPRVAGELRAGLTDGSPAVRRLAAEMLGRIGARDSHDALLALLADPDAAVRVATLGALRACGPEGTSSEPVADTLRDADASVRAAAIRALAGLDPSRLLRAAEILVGDPSPAVRAELAVALIDGGEEERPHGILAGLLEAPAAEERIAGLEAVARVGGHAPSANLRTWLDDPSPAVRAAAVRALAAVDGGRSAEPLTAIVAALDDDAHLVRLAAARALGADPDVAAAPILAVLAGGSGRAQEAALVALDGRADEVRVPLIEWSLAQVRRAAELRRASFALTRAADGRGISGGTGTAVDTGTSGSAGTREGPDATGEYLGSILARRERQVVERLLLALRILGAPEASGLIRRCLRSPDPEVRAQAIEALDALGERRLGRAVVGLLDDEPDGRPSDRDDVLRSLAGDVDPWVRALALRVWSERVAGESAAIARRAMADPDPIVRSAARWRDESSAAPDPTGGSAMSETGQTLDGIERMLFLRRVPLFSELAPEDLQRIAAAAAERLYPPGEEIVREGDLGDELVVIVEGSVRVVRDDGGQARFVRTYGVGDHIGELAILREGPRSATVIAEEDGVRGLVIGGDGLRAILRERPEAAMAMLATLAERIGTQ